MKCRTISKPLIAVVQRSLAAGERFTATFDAEDTDFVRMNRGKVRQPGTVSQRYLSVRLIDGTRHAEHMLSLSGDLARDTTAVRDAVATLRAAMPELADDPLLLLPSERLQQRQRARRHASAGRDGDRRDPARRRRLRPRRHLRGGTDLARLRQFGRTAQLARDDRVQPAMEPLPPHRQGSEVGLRRIRVGRGRVRAQDGEARERLALIGRPSRTLAPGKYRAYLAPSAMEEIAATLCWGGFSGRALATKQSALAKMQEGEVLDARISLSEDTAGGVAPAFQAEGFARPARVPLIETGKLVGSLVSPRTAREFGMTENGANGAEMPESLAMTGGTLASADALAALGTGLAVGNLHYLNYSDRPACRITGMTRFATFWVENGKIVAPVDVLRFDDTVYRLLGENLEALTQETEFILDAGTYQSRQLASVRLPGALVKEMAFTL